VSDVYYFYIVTTRH